MTITRRTSTIELSPRLQEILVALPGFSGPLVTLLEQARTGSVALAELPVTLVVSQCLAYCAEHDPRTPELLADLTACAARLVAWKARALLPRPERAADNGDEEADLSIQLAAAEALRSGVVFLADCLATERRAYPRGGILTVPSTLEYPPPDSAAPQMLARALTQLAARRQPPQPLRLRPVPSLETMLERIRHRLQMGVRRFRSLIGERASRAEYAVGFLALLVLLRRGVATAVQQEPFGEIVVTLRQDPDHDEGRRLA